MFRRILAAFAVSLALFTVNVAQAQQATNTVALPPALQAAVQSGNAAAISQAITTLSAGNPIQAANLANAVVSAAERILATNPQAAVNAASAAVSAVNALPVQTSSPQQSLSVVTTASRIFRPRRCCRLRRRLPPPAQ